MKFKKLLSMFFSLCLIVSTITTISIPASAATSDPTTKRALVISAPYDSAGAITRTTYNGMVSTFTSIGATTTGYLNTAKTTASVLNIIKTTFSNSDDNDINYLFINCHGDSSGNLYINGTTGATITPSELKTNLDDKLGHFVIFINACYSGHAVNETTSNANVSINEISEEDLPYETNSIENGTYGNNFADSFMSNFLGLSNELSVASAPFTGSQKYTVYCSSLATEQSYTMPGGITRAANVWSRGFGYDIATNSSCTYLEDYCNSYDDVVTAREMYTYSKNNIGRDDQTITYYAYSDMESVHYKDYRLGDVNLDYVINGQDTLALQEHVVGLTLLTGRGLVLADVNADGAINGKDTLALKKYVAGIENNESA